GFIILVGNSYQLPAISCDVVVEGGVSAERVYHFVPRLNILTDDQPQKGIDTSTRHHVFGFNVVMRRYRFSQLAIFRVAIFPNFRSFLLHGCDYGRCWAKAALIGANTCRKWLASLGFQRLGPDKGHGSR